MDREWKYGYDGDGRLTEVTYPDGCTQKYTYNNDLGGSGVDDKLLVAVTDCRGDDWNISYANKKWWIDNSDTGTSDNHETTYDWAVDSYTLPEGLVFGGSPTANSCIKCTKTVPHNRIIASGTPPTYEDVVNLFFHQSTQGPGLPGNLVKRSVQLSSTPTYLNWYYVWGDQGHPIHANPDLPASTPVNDNLLYLTCTPFSAANHGCLVQRTEYTPTDNGFKLVSKTYPMYGNSTGSYGVNGINNVKNELCVHYTYTWRKHR